MICETGWITFALQRKKEGALMKNDGYGDPFLMTAHQLQAELLRCE